MTEQGFADVGGLFPRQRAHVIIIESAHPDFKPIMVNYLERAEYKYLKKGLQPYMLWQTFQMLKNLGNREGYL